MYVPHRGWNGPDGLTYAVLDHAGGGRRSIPRFGAARAWSPPAHVALTVAPRANAVYGTWTVASLPPADGTRSSALPMGGWQTSPVGDAPALTDFVVHVERYPAAGELLDPAGAGPLPAVAAVSSVRYRAPAAACGGPLASFLYWLQNDTLGAGIRCHTRPPHTLAAHTPLPHTACCPHVSSSYARGWRQVPLCSPSAPSPPAHNAPPHNAPPHNAPPLLPLLLLITLAAHTPPPHTLAAQTHMLLTTLAAHMPPPHKACCPHASSAHKACCPHACTSRAGRGATGRPCISRRWTDTPV